MGSKLGSALGAVGDMGKKAVGEIAPFFEDKAAANEDLMNKQPTWLSATEPTSVGFDDRHRGNYPTMTHIRNFVRAEFLRREQNFGNYYTKSSPWPGEHADHQIGGVEDAGYFDYEAGHSNYRSEMFLSDDYVGSTYKGPKSAWTRVVSNTMKDGFEGFVLHGVDNFEDMYGFNPDLGTDGQSVMGYDTKEKPHIMEEPDFKHRPSPGVTGIDCEDMGPAKAQKKTTIKFTVWSRAQLDYISPYFCTVGNTVLVEWGWNTFPRDALIDLKEKNSPPDTISGEPHHVAMALHQINAVRASHPDRELKPLQRHDLVDGMTYIYREGTGQTGLWNSVSKTKIQLRKGKGNYSFVLGMITNYNYSLRDDGGYDVTVEAMSMSGIAQSLNKTATKVDDTEAKKGDHVLDLENFVNDFLDEIVTEQDEDPDDNSWFDDGYSTPSMQKLVSKHMDNPFSKTSILASQGRYFAFGNTTAALGTDDNKQYMAGSPSDASYITLGWLVDILNVFFGKESEATAAEQFSFHIDEERCVAHPNLKSTDGSVLLIPNAMAPRHNLEQFRGNTIGMAGESGDPGWFSSAQPTEYEEDGLKKKNESESYNILARGKNNPQRDAFIAMVEAMEGLAPGTLGDGEAGLKQAMLKSPRDDIHNLMTLHPHIDGDDNGSYQKGQFEVKAFPDYYVSEDKTFHSNGYSGRIKDLFVNLKVVKDAVKNNQTATSILRTILKKMSQAAGGIWDFDIVGRFPEMPNNTQLTIKDRKFSANTVDEVQRSDKTFIFKAHQKNSIIRSCGVDVSIPGEIAGMVLFGNKSGDADSAFYARKDEDMVLKTAKVLDPSGKTYQKSKNKQGSKKYANEQSYIMGIYVWDGATNAYGNVAVGMSDGNENLSTGDDDEPVIDIEFVDPHPNRMKSLLKHDRNPKNCVKYNMALDGIELSMQLDGIEGIRLWDVFSCTGVPTEYYMNGLWRVTNIKHSISGTDWTTDISAQFAPNSAESISE